MINPRPGRDDGIRFAASPPEPKREWFGPGKFSNEWSIKDRDVAWAWTAGALRALPGAVAFTFTHQREQHGSYWTIVCIVPVDGLGFTGRFKL